MRKQKFTRDETTTILIACLFNLANAMSAVFMNVYLYAYTGSLIVMSVYTIVRIGLFPLFFTLGGKWAQKHSFAGPLATGLVFIMLSLLFVLAAQDQFAVHPELVYGVAALTGIGEGLFWLSLNSLNQIVSSPQSRSRFLSSVGICNNIGTHPAIGLAPARLYSSIVARWRSTALSCPGYLALSSSTCGRNTRILADDI